MAALPSFRQFVLKVQSRCDLACDHCYVYEHADQSWRGRPAVMDVETMAHAAGRIAEHAKNHGLAVVSVVLHGGEPLLCGPERLSRLINTLQAGLRGTCELDLRVHTNGVLLDSRFCEMFRARGVKVGISLDGDRSANDRHRRYSNGRSSYDKVVRAIELLRTRFPDLYSGLLCTIDVANDPRAVYAALIAHDPPAIDFLLPHATWDQPPIRASETDYADWLLTIFDEWLSTGRPVPVRTFDSIISTSRGGAGLTESLGLEPSDVLVVETDGTYEQADSLKTAFDGAPATGMDVFRNSLDEVSGHAGIAARQGGLEVLCTTCRACPVVESCGGGLFAHRYQSGSGFDNPSVFCPDLLKLIGYVTEHTTRPPHTVRPAVLRSLAAGCGGAEAITALEEGQRSIRRALVASVARPSPEWDLLCRIDAELVDAVFADPHTRVWAVGRFRDLTPDGRLAAIAAVAAARAGVDADLDVPVRDGFVYLPAVGGYAVPQAGMATVEVRGGEIHLAGAAAVRPVRRLTAGSLTVTLDDLDPERDCHEQPAAERLTGEQVAVWQRRFCAAWELIESRYPEYAPALEVGLSTIVPLAGPEAMGSAVRDAFGSVAISLPGDAETLCLLLLREFQRMQLGAVLDLFDFSANASDDTLLCDSYAQLAVTDFWRRRALSTAEFDEAQARTAKSIETLLGSGSLTPRGTEFVREMRSTLTSWSAARVG